MAKNKKNKGRKLPTKKPEKTISKKFNRKKKKQQRQLQEPLPPPSCKDESPPTPTDSDSDPGSDSDDSESEILSNPSRLHELLEAYSKSHLIDLIAAAALSRPALLNRVRATADRDVTQRKIFVHGLGWDATREALLATFRPFGEITDCNVVTDRATGRSKGYGFVLFNTRQAAAKALKEPKKKINNRIASCQLASIGPVPQSQSQDTTGRKIYVSNVPPETDSEKLLAFFGRFGEVETGPIGFDMQTGRSRGFALFVYKTKEGARKALEEPYRLFEGHQLHCQKATEGKNRAPVAAQEAPAAPVLAALAAAQNLMFSQHPSLNPVYGSLMANPSAGYIGSVNPMVAAGALGAPGVIPSGQLAQVSAGSFGGASGLAGYDALSASSLLGAYAANAQSLGLQQLYPNSQLGQPSTSGALGNGGSFRGFPSYM